jgi:hypothetical protein
MDETFDPKHTPTGCDYDPYLSLNTAIASTSLFAKMGKAARTIAWCMPAKRWLRAPRSRCSTPAVLW